MSFIAKNFSIFRSITGSLSNRVTQLQQFQSSAGLSTTNRIMNIFKIQSNEDFEDKVKNSKTPVIVDFFATWCNPCKMLTPRLESIIGENDGKIILAKVDVDELSDLALDYNVESLPALVVIRDGKVEERLIGLQDTDKLRTWIENVVNKK